MTRKLLAIAVLLFFSIQTMYAAEDTNNTTTIKTLKGKTLQATMGENGLTIDKYKGKILFLEFWGTQCPPCIISIPHYVQLQEKYKDDLAILAIEVQATPREALKKFVATKKMNYDTVEYNDGMVLTQFIIQKAGWRGEIPYLVIFDQEGEAQLVQPGLVAKETLEIMIKNMINEYKGKKKKDSKQWPPFA